MVLKGKGCEGVDWVHLAQVRIKWQNFVDTVTNLRFPSNVENFLTI